MLKNGISKNNVEENNDYGSHRGVRISVLRDLSYRVTHFII